MKDYFKIFDFAQKFVIDLDELEKKYFEFQKRFHPDKAGIAEIENSMTFNEAYEVLRNPLRRAAHILQLNGIDIEDDSKSVKPDMATLEQVLEIQEKIPEFSKEEISVLKKDLNLTIKSLLAEAALKLENKDFQDAAQIVIKAKYFDKILLDLRK